MAKAKRKHGRKAEKKATKVVVACYVMNRVEEGRNQRYEHLRKQVVGGLLSRRNYTRNNDPGSSGRAASSYWLPGATNLATKLWISSLPLSMAELGVA
jgi:hypothetical protein